MSTSDDGQERLLHGPNFSKGNEKRERRPDRRGKARAAASREDQVRVDPDSTKEWNLSKIFATLSTPQKDNAERWLDWTMDPKVEEELEREKTLRETILLRTTKVSWLHIYRVVGFGEGGIHPKIIERLVTNFL